MHTPANLDTRMQQLIDDWQRRPYLIGTTDCCQLARAAVWQLYGVLVDHPDYNTERQALRLLASVGGYRGLLAVTHTALPGTMDAARGDIAIIQGRAPYHEALAVVTGTHAHTTAPYGLLAVPRSEWVQVWRLSNA